MLLSSYLILFYIKIYMLLSSYWFIQLDRFNLLKCNNDLNYLNLYRRKLYNTINAIRILLNIHTYESVDICILEIQKYENILNVQIHVSDNQTNIYISFNKVFNSLSLCVVYLVLLYKPLQTFIIYFICIQYRYTVSIQHTVTLIVDQFFIRCSRVVQGAGRKAKRMVLQCINGVGSNPVEGRTKI